TSLFLCTRLLPPTSTLFPYTTLFRSRPVRLGDRVVDRLAQRRGAGGAGRRRDAGDAGPGPGGAGPGRSLGLAVLRHWGAPRRGALRSRGDDRGTGLLVAAERGGGPCRLAPGPRALRLGQDPAPPRPRRRDHAGRAGAGPPISGSCRRASTRRLKPSSPAPGRTTPCWTAA